MKKKKSTKVKNKKIIKFLFFVFLIIIIAIFCYKKKEDTYNKKLEANARDAFVAQSIMIADNLKKEYTDIESLENDDEISFVSDAAIKTGKSDYYIRVNYGANCVNIYTKDDEKNYTVPYKSMICSTGISTPKSGTYQITYKYRWLRLFGNVYGQYSTRIVKNILFHSVPYFKQRADTLEYEEFDKLGTKASAGCIRLTVEDSKWIYDNIPSGTYVEFYSDPQNPGPLGKPKAPKISDNEECRNWDPTDPDENNPWNGGSGIPSVTYSEPTNKNNNTQNKNTNNTANKTTTPPNNENRQQNFTNTNKDNTDTKNNTLNNSNKDDNKTNKDTTTEPNDSKNNVSSDTAGNNPSQPTKNPENSTTTTTTTATTTPNTPTDNSKPIEDNKKPAEKPSEDAVKPNNPVPTPSKPVENPTQEKPKEPEKTETPTTTTTTTTTTTPPDEKKDSKV